MAMNNDEDMGKECYKCKLVAARQTNMEFPQKDRDRTTIHPGIPLKVNEWD